MKTGASSDYGNEVYESGNVEMEYFNKHIF